MAGRKRTAAPDDGDAQVGKPPDWVSNQVVLIFLLIFVAVFGFLAFILFPNLSTDQRSILRFVFAIGGGALSTFLTGSIWQEAVIIPNEWWILTGIRKVIIKASGGISVFLLLLFVLFPRDPDFRIIIFRLFKTEKHERLLDNKTSFKITVYGDEKIQTGTYSGSAGEAKIILPTALTEIAARVEDAEGHLLLKDTSFKITKGVVDLDYNYDDMEMLILTDQELSSFFDWYNATIVTVPWLATNALFQKSDVYFTSQYNEVAKKISVNIGALSNRRIERRFDRTNKIPIYIDHGMILCRAMSAHIKYRRHKNLIKAGHDTSGLLSEIKGDVSAIYNHIDVFDNNTKLNPLFYSRLNSEEFFEIRSWTDFGRLTADSISHLLLDKKMSANECKSKIDSFYATKTRWSNEDIRSYQLFADLELK